MSKVNGKTGDVFICYAEEGKPTFNIVTNGDENANGGVDDGIFEFRRVTYDDMTNGDILDQIAKKNTLNGWERYTNKTPESSNVPPPPDPSKTPPPDPSAAPPDPSKTPPPDPSLPDPSKTPPPDPSASPPDPSKPRAQHRTIDPENVSAEDINSVYPQSGTGSDGTTPFTHMVNDIKKKAGLEGTGQLYLRQGDIRMAADTETDPNKKAVFEWLHEHFNAIDYVKYGGWDIQGRQNFEDGLIGAGDLEKYFGKRA